MKITVSIIYELLTNDPIDCFWNYLSINIRNKIHEILPLASKTILLISTKTLKRFSTDWKRQIHLADGLNKKVVYF